MAPVPNPWSPEHWDPVAQANYIRKYGMARAVARAHDAGTTVHGAPPIPKYDHKKHVKAVRAIVIRRNALRNAATENLFISNVGMDLGYTQVEVEDLLTQEIDIVLSPGDITFGARFKLGINESPPAFGLQRYIFPARYNLGISEAADASATISPGAFHLGVDETFVLDRTLFVNYNFSLGLRETAVTGDERDIEASMTLGFSANDNIAINVESILAHPSLGFTQSALLSFERDIVASPSLGFNESAAVTQSMLVSFDVGVEEMAVDVGAVRYVAANMDVGVTESATPYLERDLIVTQSLGIDAAPLVDIEYDITASAELGITETPRFDVQIDNVFMSLGIDEATAVYMEARIASSMGLGFNETASTATEALISASPSIGIDEAATVMPALVPISIDLGFDQTTVPYVEVELNATAHLGIAEAVTTYVEAQVAASLDLGVSETLPVYGVDLERNTTNDIHIGFEVTDAILQMDSFLTLTDSLGVDVAATLSRESDLVSSQDLGVSFAPVISQISPAALSIQFLQNEPLSASWNSGNTTTITGENFGSADAARYIVITYGNTVARNLLSATIGGVAATILTQNGAGASESTGVIMAAVPTGTSGTVVLNWSGTPDIVSLGVYKVLAPAGITRVAVFAGSSTGSNTTPNYSETLALTGGSAYFAADMATNSGGAPSFTLTTATKDSDETTSNRSFVSGHYGPVVDGTSTFDTTTVHGGSINSHSYAVLAPEADLTPAPSLGISESAALSTTVVTVIPSSGAVANAMGITETATLTRIQPISAAMALGLTEAAAVQASAPAITTTYQTNTAINNQASATYSFNTIGIGTANASRYVVVGYIIKGNTSQTISTFTIGGVTATLVGTAQGTTNAANGMCGVAIALVPTGTTANIVITLSGGFTASTSNGIGIDVWTAVGTVNTTPTDTFEANANVNPSKAFTVPAGGFVVVICGTSSVAGTRSLGTDFPPDDNYVQYVAGKFRVTSHAANATAASVTKTLAGTALTGTTFPTVGYAFGH